MLRTCINIKQNTDIKYPKLIAFLKKQASGYKPKKSLTFEREEVDKFLAVAPNEVYLSMKWIIPVLLFALCGGCRCDELCKITINDIQDRNDILLVTIPGSKTKKKRWFIISDENINGVSTLAIYRKYVVSRNPETPHSRFFVAFHQGKCTQRGEVMVAQFLKLENAHQYTGQCLRRTSATLLVNAGGDILTLKQHGGWESSTVAEGYVAECISKKRKVASQILTGQRPSEERPNRNISIASTSCSEPNNLFAKKTQTLNEPEVHSKDRLDMESVIIRSTTNQQDIVNVSSEGSSSTGGISFNNLKNYKACAWSRNITVKIPNLYASQ
ncbi:hypothetical protein NQ315_000068 [Exocentrus adspersus]|uniref:Tyr recombinase domain-containing protein n=1 Tax=Exocentrus adspersus TaxID=1586481 RepID=A0AAV8VUJ9_9CUCU|nr:hypothetical protein NQ315_000068 [Exocentrus adspersus]